MEFTFPLQVNLDIINSIETPIIAIDSVGNIIFFNQTSKSLFPDIVNKSSVDFFKVCFPEIFQSVESVSYHYDNKMFPFLAKYYNDICYSWSISLISEGLYSGGYIFTGHKSSSTDTTADVYIRQTLIDNIPAQIFWKDTNLNYLGCNAAFLKTMGLTCKEQIIGKTDYDLPVSKTDSDKYRADDLNIITSKMPKLDIHETQLLIDGTEKHLITNKVPLFDSYNNVFGILAIYIDYTKQKQLERALYEANEAKDKFIRNMSHDIRTPLSGIIGISDILEKEANSDIIKEHAHMINTSGEQLLILFNSILDIIATGNQNENKLNLSCLDIRKLLQDIVSLELPTVKMKGLEFKVSIDEELPELIESDQIKIHRILLNLLGNAVKFTEKGFIELGARIVNKSKKQMTIEFYVQDSGPGIKLEDQDKIFNKFYRGTPSYQGIYAGHGVGLHIVKEYTNILNGSIQFESKPGLGTRFKLAIPVSLPSITESVLQIESDSITALEASTQFVLSPYVLLIEDNSIALKVAENTLSKLKIRFKSATNGQNAYELFISEKFDLVITDIGLPDTNGMALTKKFIFYEQANQLSHTPVFGLTAHSVKEIELEGLESGMTSVLTKPIRPESLISLMEKYHLTSYKTSVESSRQIDNKSFNKTLESYPLLDINAGVSILGSKEVLVEALKMLRDENQKDLDLIENAWVQNDFAQIKHLAHRMKGGAVYSGVTRMYYACQSLEEQLKIDNSKTDILDNLYEQFCLINKQTLKAIEFFFVSG